MEKDFIDKLKNYFHVLPKIILFILKSAVLIFICIKLLYVFAFIAMFIMYIYLHVAFFQENQIVYYLTGITTQIFQIAVYYFISKKLGIIKAFDKFPFWVSFVIAAVYEIIIIYFVAIGFGNMLDCINNPVHYIKRIIDFSLHGYGYFYTFLYYSIKRLTSYFKCIKN